MVRPELHEWVTPTFWDPESNQMVAKHTSTMYHDMH